MPTGRQTPNPSRSPDLPPILPHSKNPGGPVSNRPMPRGWILVVGTLVAASCGPPRVAKVGGAGDDAGTSEGTSDPGWNDETTAQPGEEGYDEFGEVGDDGPRYDVQGTGKLDVPPYHHACPDPLPSTMVEGQTEMGDFTGIHAYFGDAWGEIELVLYDDDATLDDELDHAGWTGGDIDVGPALTGFILADWDQLPVQDVFSLTHVVGFEEYWFMATVTIDEAEFDDEDPYVPMVVRGTIAPWPDENAADALSGSFAASRCSVFENPFPIE